MELAFLVLSFIKTALKPPKKGRTISYDDSITFSTVFSHGTRWNSLSTLTAPNLASSKAKRIPMHALGPCPKDRNVNLDGWRLFINGSYFSATSCVHRVPLSDYSPFCNVFRTPAARPPNYGIMSCISGYSPVSASSVHQSLTGFASLCSPC